MHFRIILYNNNNITLSAYLFTSLSTLSSNHLCEICLSLLIFKSSNILSQKNKKQQEQLPCHKLRYYLGRQAATRH